MGFLGGSPYGGAAGDTVDVMSRVIALVTSALVAAGLLVTAAPAQAASGWSAPEMVSAPGLPATRPSTWLGRDGHGSLAMQVGFNQIGGNYSVQVADRRPDGSWDAPIVLSNAGIDAYAPIVAGNEEGLVCAAWSQEVGASRQARAACKDGAAAWGASAAVDIVFGNIADMDMAVAPDGRVALVVLGYSENFQAQRVSVSTFENGVWSAPKVLVSGNAQGAALLSGVEGEALSDSTLLVTWHGSGGIFSSYLDPNSILWTLGDARSATNPLAVTLVASGDTATLLWTQRDVANNVTLEGEQWRDSAWGMQSTLQSFAQQAPIFSATAAPAGVVAVTWAETIPGGYTIRALVAPSLAVEPVGGYVVNSTPPLTGPVIAPDGQGNFFVAYQAGRRETQSVRVTHFSIVDGAIDAGTSEEVSPASDASVDPTSLLHAGSTLLVTWSQGMAGTESIMTSSVNDPAPPLRVRAKSKKRGQITVTWRAPAGGAGGYIVQVRQGNGEWTTAGKPRGTATSWTWKRGQARTAYDVRMASTRGSVIGPWSPTVSVTTK